SLGNKRIVLLTGGGGTLGRALLARKPDDVYVISITKTSVSDLHDVFTCHFDLSKDEEKIITYIESLVECVDVLINAAFITHHFPLGQSQKDLFLNEFKLNVFTPIRLGELCTNRFWSKRPKDENLSRRRKIINISSGAAFGMTGRPDLAVYSGAKAALNVMTEYLHEYMSPYGASAHIIAPGSLLDERIKDVTTRRIWELQSEQKESFSLQKVF
ncbi:SDR family oxidoreductase, partial [Candidatus Kaiserbacteria bacterium]|nr:SDR family oxidoreductase [Candidatus Kaiserbacteria bacterium]